MAEQKLKGRFGTKFKYGPNINDEAFGSVDSYEALCDASKVSIPPYSEARFLICTLSNHVYRPRLGCHIPLGYVQNFL
jgi:hypothetical protein